MRKQNREKYGMGQVKRSGAWKWLFIAAAFLVLGTVQAATADVYTSYHNSAWTDTCTWAGCPPPGSGYPGSGDTANAKHAITFGTQGVGTLNLVGGTLSGTKLTIESGGTLSTGTLNLAVYENKGTLAITGSRLLGGATLNNLNTINQSNTYYIYNDGTSLNNSGTYNITTDADISNGVSGTPVINNTGTFAKTGGTGTSAVTGNTFNNQGGTISAQTGTLSIGSLAGNGGILNAAAGATLTIQGANLTNAAYTGSGGGTVKLEDFQGTATFNMPGSLLQWSGGTMTGASTVFTNTGNLAIAGSTSLQGGATLNNLNTINQSNTSYIYNDGTSLNNSGTYNITTDADISNGVGGRPVINNTGTFAKTGGTGISKVNGIAFNNQGTVEVKSGTLQLDNVQQLPGNTLTGGTWNVRANATLTIGSGGSITKNQGNVTLDGVGSTFAKINSLANNEGSFTIMNGRNFATSGAFANSGTLTVGVGTGDTSIFKLGASGISILTNTGTLTGSGTIQGHVQNSGIVAPGSSPGLLTISGDYTQTAAGKLVIELGGDVRGVGYDALDITGKADITGSNLIIALYGKYNPLTGTYDILHAAGGVTGEFGTLAGPSGWTWTLSYLDTDRNDVIDTVRLNGVQNPVPVPAAVWLLGSGLLGLWGFRRKFRK